MGVSVTVDETTKKTRTYPCLMVSDHSGLIVLAMKDDGSTKFSGTVVYRGESTTFVVGRHSDTWELSSFSQFYGAVTLKGE